MSAREPEYHDGRWLWNAGGLELTGFLEISLKISPGGRPGGPQCNGPDWDARAGSPTAGPPLTGGRSSGFKLKAGSESPCDLQFHPGWQLRLASVAGPAAPSTAAAEDPWGPCADLRARAFTGALELSTRELRIQARFGLAARRGGGAPTLPLWPVTH